MKKPVTIIFILSALCVGGVVYAATQTTHPSYGSIQQSFTELARTRLSKIYDINMPLWGELSRIDLEPGDTIKKGQIVAELAETPWAGPFYQSKGKIQSLEAQYNFQVRELKRREKLGEKDFISKQAIDEAQSKKNDLLGQLVEEKANLRVAEYHLNQIIIRSPIDGVVLKRNTQGGKWIIVGETLLEVGDLNDIEVICDVLTQDAQRLHMGDTVIYSSVGTPVVLKGKVKHIEPKGFTKKSSLGVDEQRVNIISTIKHPNVANLGVGYRLQAKFLVGKKQQQAMLIPRFSVLQDNQGRYYVFKVIDKKLRKQFVKLGIKTDSKVSILEGLSTSDIIVSQPTADMRDGMKL